MELFPYIASLVVACAVSVGLMPAVIRLAHRAGVVDKPGGRRVHDGRIPRLGGIGIFLGFVAGVGTATLLAGRAANLSDPADYHWVGVAFGMAFMFASGLLDDLYGLSAGRKLALQIAAAGIAVASGFRIDALTAPYGGPLNLGWAAPLFTLAWILLIVNAMNLIDGLDGLAGGLALIVTTTVASVALAMNRFGVVISALALAGALMGFLKFNFTPARIFMGDGGSQFLGYVLAVVSIRGSQKGATAVAILVPLLAFGLPLADLLTTILRRALRREEAGTPNGNGIGVLVRRVASADREHLHHNLLALGLSPRKAVLCLYLVAALFALTAYLSIVKNTVPLAAFTLLLSVGSVTAIKLATAMRAVPEEAVAESRESA